MANVIDVNGSSRAQIELPQAFSERVRPELIRRAVLAENSYRLQPQAHFVLAGMQTTATYYGAMHSYRSGRHQGQAIRPRQKLGGGAQGEVRRIPSSKKGKRAHPHVVEKKIFENMNRREYQAAVRSAIAATAAKAHHPFIFTNELESLSKTREVIGLLGKIGLSSQIRASSESKRVKRGLRRNASQRTYRKSVLFVVSSGNILRSARNIAGVDVCKVDNITANLLAPGGNPGRTTIWSENAIKKLDKALEGLELK